MPEEKSRQIKPATDEEIKEMINNKKFDPDASEPNAQDTEDLFFIQETIKKHLQK